jgi:AraC family transcriptional regulator
MHLLVHRPADLPATGQPSATISSSVAALASAPPRPRPTVRKPSALAKWRLARTVDYVEAHLNRPVRLADIAASAGLSAMHFAAQFRAATGYRPREYLQHRRIARAQHLLSTSGRSLADVALDVGFQTQAHFTTIFKRVTGETPAKWRASNYRGADLVPVLTPPRVEPERSRAQRADIAERARCAAAQR